VLGEAVVAGVVGCVREGPGEPDALRGHWGIESMHRVLDVVFHEDQSRIREGYAGENLALLRRVALALLKRSPRQGHNADQAAEGRLG
jgi:predicted transposase YbfD/YdcC